MRKQSILLAASLSIFVAWQASDASFAPLKSTKTHSMKKTKDIAQTVPRQRQVDQGGFPVELQGCQRLKDIVTCSILVTNAGDADLPIIFRDPGFYSSNIPKAFDVSGEQYKPEEIQIGKESTKGRFGLGST